MAPGFEPGFYRDPPCWFSDSLSGLVHTLEAPELLEIFQWKTASEVEGLKDNGRECERVKEELGDVLIYALTMAHEFNLKLDEIILNKIAVNEVKS